MDCLSDVSDEELMMRTRSGDVVAFEELVNRHRVRLALYIANVLGNKETAEDLAQETFIRAYRARKRYVPRARWTTWVRKIAQNLSRDERRRRAHDAFTSLDEPRSSAYDASPLRDTIADSRVSPADDLLCRNETLEAVRRSLTHLSPKHAEVLRLRVYHDMNYQEIATHLGVSLGTVKSRIHYAVEQLRDILDGTVGAADADAVIFAASNRHSDGPIQRLQPDSTFDRML